MRKARVQRGSCQEEEKRDRRREMTRKTEENREKRETRGHPWLVIF